MFKCPFCGAEFAEKRYYDAHVVKCPYQYGKPKEEEIKNEKSKTERKKKEEK